MGISKGKKTPFSKPISCAHNKKLISNSRILSEISRRNGVPHQISAVKPPKASVPPTTSVPPTASVPPTKCVEKKDKTPDPIIESISRDSLVRSMLGKPFKKVCELLMELDLDQDHGLISEMILHFSLRIYGLPKCRTEDLLLAVYFFIEKTFAIKSKIVLCVELEEEGQSSVIGVVFETIRMKCDILRKAILLKGSDVRLKDNTNLDWITESLCTTQ